MANRLLTNTQTQPTGQQHATTSERTTPRLPLKIIYRIIELRITDDFDYPNAVLSKPYFQYEHINNAQAIGKAYPFLYAHLIKTILNLLTFVERNYVMRKAHLDDMRIWMHPRDREAKTRTLLLLKTWLVFIEDGLRAMARRLGWTDLIPAAVEL